jgi:hypothetical protein
MNVPELLATLIEQQAKTNELLGQLLGTLDGGCPEGDSAAEQFKRISQNLSEASAHASNTGTRLLQIAALTKMANESGEIGLDLLRADRANEE